MTFQLYSGPWVLLFISASVWLSVMMDGTRIVEKVCKSKRERTGIEEKIKWYEFG